LNAGGQFGCFVFVWGVKRLDLAEKVYFHIFQQKMGSPKAKSPRGPYENCAEPRRQRSPGGAFTGSSRRQTASAMVEMLKGSRRHSEKGGIDAVPDTNRFAAVVKTAKSKYLAQVRVGTALCPNARELIATAPKRRSGTIFWPAPGAKVRFVPGGKRRGRGLTKGTLLQIVKSTAPRIANDSKLRDDGGVNMTPMKNRHRASAPREVENWAIILTGPTTDPQYSNVVAKSIEFVWDQ
jgi:hypothetical protein